MEKKYVFKPYSKTFPNLFAREKERILSQIKDVLRIEHIGSTAVPHLGGKGIIDLAILVEEEKIACVCKKLKGLGYEFRESGSTPERLYFRIDLPDKEEQTTRYHLHLMQPESKEFREMLSFRDYLRNHPQEAKDYADLKKKAADEVNQDGGKYRRLKNPTFRKVLDQKEGHD